MKSVTSRTATAVLAMFLALVSGLGLANAQGDDTIIVVGGIEVLRIRAAHAGVTPQQRAADLRARLLDIYEKVGHAHKPLSGADVTVDTKTGAIRVRGILLLTVTHEDAKANGTKLDVLAKQWHVLLRDAVLRGAPVPLDDQYPQDTERAPQPDPQPSQTPSPNR